MRMTLPTTRIDTLSSPGLRGESIRSNQSTSQEILLVDLVPNGPVANATMMNPSNHTSQQGQSQQQQQQHHSHHHNIHTGGGGMVPPPPQSQMPVVLNRYPVPITNSGTNVYPAHNVQQPSLPLPPPPQSMPPHLNLPLVSNQSNVNHNNNNDLSNFTLVNLSNQPEPGDEDDDEEDDVHLDEESSSVNFVNMKSHIPLRRSSIPGGPQSTSLPLSMFAGNKNTTSKLSSSLSTSSASSDDDSDTGFLVPLNNGVLKGRAGGVKDSRLYHHRVQSNSVQSTSYPGSPGFNQGVNQLHRKRLRRRRSSGRRKPNSQPEHNESSDFVSLCCCFGDDDHHHPHHHHGNHNRGHGQNNSQSLTSRYLRFSCFIVMIIAVATFASIMVSLQRKVDSLSWEVKKMSVGGSRTGSSTSSPAGNGGKGSSQDNRNPNPSVIQDLIAKQEQLNSSYYSLKSSLDDLNQKISNVEKQPSVEEVRQDLARLGSDLKGSIEELQKDVTNLKNFKKSNEADATNNNGISKENSLNLDASATASSSGIA